jgi:HlyD family secretion protein
MRIISIAALFLFLTACEQNSESMALGTLERARISHSATTNEVVIALPVAQGEQVSEGTVLVQLDDTQQKAQVLRSSAEVTQARVTLEKLRAGAREEEIAVARANVAGARAKLARSEADYKRQKNLKQNLTSQANLDQARAARDSDLAFLHNTEEKLRELIKGARAEDLQIAEAQLEAASAMLAVEEKKLADLTIRATRAGILDNLPWNLGERVTAGSPLAIVLAGSAPHARVYIPEPYRIKIHVNDEMTVHVDGLDKSFVGKVRWISNEPAFTPYYALNQQERARLMYLAEIQLPEEAAALPNGVPAQVVLP